MTLTLLKNPDILKTIANIDHPPFTVGFAAETEDVISNARAKLIAKNLDMIIANDVANKSIGFNSDENETTVISKTANGISELHQPKMSKDSLARALISLIAKQMANAE